MKLIIRPQVYEKYPALRIGVVVAKGIRVRDRDPDLEQLKRLLEEKVRTQGLTPSTLERHPFIASWRSVYESFGADTQKYRPSAETTVRRILAGGHSAGINTVVDIWQVAQCAHLLSVGGYDLQSIKGDVVLRFSGGGEPFTPVGHPERLPRSEFSYWQTGAQELTFPGEVVYADQDKVLTRCWNWRDCDQARITGATTEVATFLEAAEIVVPNESLLLATNELAGMISDYCGGEVSSFIATARDGLVYELT